MRLFIFFAGIVLIILFIILILAALTWKIGVKLRRRLREKQIHIVMDTNDEEAFANVLRIFSPPGVLGFCYDDKTDTLRIIVTVTSASYQAYMEKLREIPRIEVI